MASFGAGEPTGRCLRQAGLATAVGADHQRDGFVIERVWGIRAVGAPMFQVSHCSAVVIVLAC